MIPAVTYFNLAQFVATMGVLPELQLDKLGIAHWLNQSKAWKTMFCIFVSRNVSLKDTSGWYKTLSRLLPNTSEI